MSKIPKTPDETTPEWLTTALRSSNAISKSEIISHTFKRVGEAEGFTGFLARFLLEYSEREENAPASIVAKFSPSDPELLASF